MRPVGDARQVAEREGVEIRSYSVIYRAIEELRAAMQGMLEPDEVETPLGQAEVRQLFKASRIGTIAGSFVTEGNVTRGAQVRIVREGTVIYDTTIESLRRFSEDVREVTAASSAASCSTNFQDLHEGDVLETYETRQVERELLIALGGLQGHVRPARNQRARMASGGCAGSMRRPPGDRRRRLRGSSRTRGLGFVTVTDVRTKPRPKARARVRERARPRRRAPSDGRARGHARRPAQRARLPAGPRRRRAAPQAHATLEFVYDETTDRAMRVEQLLREGERA